MATYPPRGKRPWDVELKAYIDGRVNDTEAGSTTDEGVADKIANGVATPNALSAYVESVVEGHTPGAEMAYAEVDYLLSTTQLFSSLTIPVYPLVLTVTGQGRPVEIEYYFPSVLHSVANTGVGILLASTKNGANFTAENQIYVYSPWTTQGVPAVLRRRKVLEEGAEYVFNAFVGGLVAGTSYLSGSANYRRCHSSVVSR